MDKNEVCLCEKYALTLPEVAAYFGIGEKKLRRMIDDYSHIGLFLQVGVKHMIKREKNMVKKAPTCDIMFVCHVRGFLTGRRTNTSEKRRDSKNRILRNGESQKPDGRYVFKYYDLLHKPHYLYSWKLEPTDKLPAGKKNGLSLREKIRQLQNLMGHSEISVTMDTYTHLGLQDAWEELQRVQLQCSRKELGLRLVKSA